MEQMSLEKRAAKFAAHWHGSTGQVRKYTGEPYINHPAAVAALVASVPHDEIMLAAAWLHDVVEDTPCTLLDIHNAFGLQVAALVEQLTDVSKPADGNRAKRKEMDRLHLSSASSKAKTIKLADLIDNSHSILERDPDFAKVYITEKRMLLEVLREGDAQLWDQAKRIVESLLQSAPQDAPG
jgi:guanosine-3',5'-bis(diphosphate) 3'-pyrophosphohydrolase